MSVVAITVDGVLRKSAGGTAIDVGLEMYMSFAGGTQIIGPYDVVLLTDERQDSGTLQNFLDVSSLAYHVDIIYSDVILEGMDAGARRVAQLSKAAMHGNHVGLVIEPDPAVSAHLIANGYNTLTFTHAQYSKPSWRPDYVEETRPWSDLSQQVADNARLRAEDTRLNRLEAKDR